MIEASKSVVFRSAKDRPFAERKATLPTVGNASALGPERSSPIVTHPEDACKKIDEWWPHYPVWLRREGSAQRSIHAASYPAARTGWHGLRLCEGRGLPTLAPASGPLRSIPGARAESSKCVANRP